MFDKISLVEILLAVTICTDTQEKSQTDTKKKMPSLPTHGSPQPLSTGNATYMPMAEDAGRSNATGTIPKDGK